MSIFYKRFCEVEFSVNEKKITLPQDLKYRFLCSKTLYGTPNSLTLSVFNVAKKVSLSDLKTGGVVKLRAGYENDLKLVCQQDIVKSGFELIKPERILNVESLDSQNAFAFKKIKISFAKNTFLQQVLTKVLNEISIPIRTYSIVLLQKFASGYSYVGSIAACLDELATKGNFFWSCQNGDLLLIGKKEFSKKIPFNISDGDVFIQKPEKIENANYFDEDKKSLSGVTFSILLKPEIEPGDTIVLKSDSVNGTFRVEEITHAGDTFSNEFFTTIKAFSLSSLPSFDITTLASRVAGAL